MAATFCVSSLAANPAFWFHCQLYLMCYIIVSVTSLHDLFLTWSITVCHLIVVPSLILWIWCPLPLYWLIIPCYLCSSLKFITNLANICDVIASVLSVTVLNKDVVLTSINCSCSISSISRNLHFCSQILISFYWFLCSGCPVTSILLVALPIWFRLFVRVDDIRTMAYYIDLWLISWLWIFYLILFIVLGFFNNLGHVDGGFLMIACGIFTILLVIIVCVSNIATSIVITIPCNQSPFIRFLPQRIIGSAMWRNIKSFQIVIIHNTISNTCCIFPTVILKTLSSKIFLKSCIW